MTALAQRSAQALPAQTAHPSRRADLAIWDVEHPAHLAWQIAGLAPRHVIFEGRARG